MPRRVGWERYTIGVTGLALIVIAVCIITLTPTPVDQGQQALIKELLSYLHSKGVPQWFGYNKLEFSANILMFVPLGFFVGLLLPLRRVWIGGLAGTTFSVFVEVVQYLLLPERFASVLDVLANTVGGWIGIGIAVLLRLLMSWRDRRIVADALAWHDARRAAGLTGAAGVAGGTDVAGVAQDPAQGEEAGSVVDPADDPATETAAHAAPTIRPVSPAPELPSRVSQ